MLKSNILKKFFLMIICSSMFVSIFAGCSNRDKTSPETNNETAGEKGSDDSNDGLNGIDINIGCMKGPTAIGMIKLLSDSDSGKSINKYKYTIAGTADVISTGLIKGELDIAAVPCNLASVLYNKTDGEVVTVAINTLGVLYIVESGDGIKTVKDLKGKKIYSTGQGTTPEYTLRYLLTSAGLDPDKDVTIEYKSEAAEIVAALAKETEAVAMLPQPYATVAMNNNDKLRIALDVTEEWEKISDDSTVVTGVLVARKSFIEKNKTGFENFLKEYKASTEFANADVDETAGLLEKYDIFKAAIAKKAIPYCNVCFIDGGEMKTKAEAYLQVLFKQNPAAVGNKIQEGMFYIEK